jgi:hypothetical protein
MHLMVTLRALRKRALALAIVVCGVAGCAPREHLVEDRTYRRELPILDQFSGAYSRLARPVRVVIRDRATLAQLPVTEVDVDWDRNMILLAGLGPIWQSGSGIRIVRVWKEGSVLRVEERQITGGPDETSRPQRCSPWTMVVIPRSDLNVEGYTTRVPRGAMGLD